MRNFVKIKHTGAGIVKFDPFDYQQNAIRCFRKHRMNIFRKTRQCFIGDTLVDCDSGRKKIKDIKSGDLVLSYDHTTSQPILAPVNELYINDPADLYEVQAVGHSSITTADHQYLTRRGYIEAQYLEENDVLIGAKNGKIIDRLVYSSSSLGASKEPTYDLRVPIYDNYCVDGAFVHNCGISKVSGIFALWFAMFSAHKTILIVSRKDDDAMSFLAENVKLPFSYLPEWMREAWKTKTTKDNEHEIAFTNGSKIKSLTSHPDVLRSNSSSLNIIDEAAFIQDMDAMWAAGRPTLQHGGCIVGDSLLLSTSGIVQIGKLHKLDDHQWEDIDVELYTDTGNGHASKSYYNGIVDTKQITTNDGHYIEASLQHRFKVITEDGIYDWKYVSDIDISDQLVLSDKQHNTNHITTIHNDIYDQHTSGCRLCGEQYDIDELRKVAVDDDGWCASCITTVRMLQKTNWQLPKVLDTTLATFIGVLWGDGFCSSNGLFGISCDRNYQDFIGWIKDCVSKLGGTTRNEVSDKDYNVRFNHKALWLLLAKNGLNKSTNATNLTIPQTILSANTSIHAAFLRGLFETDGSISKHYVTLSSSSILLIRQAQTLLLSMGMRSRIYNAKRTKGFSDNPQYVLRLKTINDVIKFRETIGFISKRKNDRLNNVKESKRCHNDKFTNKAAMDALYKASIGLNSDIRQNILHRIRKGAISRSYVKSLATQFTQLANTTLGTLAINDLFTDNVKLIKHSRSKTYDITEDTKNTYIANGFVSHNSVIVISTTCGVGNWYWNTWTDAEAGINEFNPLMVNWWDMKWSIEYCDALSGEMTKIAPTDGIVPTATGTYGMHHRYGRVELRPEIYGPYWSPWLEEQYRDLQEKGETWKFDQEVLAAFVGSGNTVIAKTVIEHIGTTISDEYDLVSGPQVYVNPVSGDKSVIDFTPNEPNEGLRIWHKPVLATPDRIMGGRVIEPGRKAHQYTMGADLATGKGRDYHGLEILDVDTRQQVAEGMFHCLPKTFTKIIDRVGRWYNTAIAVVERNNGGDIIIDDLNTEYAYPRLWRRTEFNGKTMSVGQYGWFTGQASKPAMNKFLLDYIRDKAGEGFTIYSRRLWKQIQIYVRKRDKSGRDTGKTEAEAGVGNYDDLVMALALALVAVPDAYGADTIGTVPFSTQELASVPVDIGQLMFRQQEILAKNDVMMPIAFGGDTDTAMSIQEELLRFTMQLGGLPTAEALRARMPIVNKKKHQF